MTALSLVQDQPQEAAIHAVEAEQALLGCVWFENGAFGALNEPVPLDAFSDPLHRVLWDVTTDLIGKGRLADPTTVIRLVRENRAVEDAGGLAYLATLVENAPAPRLIGQYAGAVMDAYRRRQIIATVQQAGQDAYRGEREPFEIAADAQRAMSTIMTDAAPDGSSLIDARAAAVATVRQLDHEAETGELRGVMCGIDCIDRKLQGVMPGELIVLAGRPSMGKTALARAIAFGAARRNPDRTIPFFCLEMNREQISKRSLAQLSFEGGRGIAYNAMRNGVGMPPELRARLTDLAQRVPPNLILDDTAVLTLEHVRRRMLAMAAKGHIGLAVVDYLQIMELWAFLSRGLTMTSAIGMVTKGLKQLAKETDCGIILLSQLSRQVEQRDNKRPQLADLRESGNIEQDASAVLFCYREAYYLEREGPRKGEDPIDHQARISDCINTMEVLCAKSREGPIGRTLQRYYAAFDVIENESLSL